jgi:ribosomal protein S3
MEIQSLRNEYDLLGIKFIIKGKLKGKRRKSNSIINIGQIPVQSLYKHIEFSKTHAFTVYGTFGLKLWVYRSKN